MATEKQYEEVGDGYSLGPGHGAIISRSPGGDIRVGQAWNSMKLANCVDTSAVIAINIFFSLYFLPDKQLQKYEDLLGCDYIRADSFK